MTALTINMSFVFAVLSNITKTKTKNLIILTKEKTSIMQEKQGLTSKNSTKILTI